MNLIGLLEFHIAHSEIQLTVCADQSLFNLSLIKLCSAFAKQSTSVTARDACPSLGKQTSFDLVGQRPGLLIINFEQVIKSFLV